MKYLIIPDIHELHAKTRRILAKYESEVDHTIFVGDFYDQWGELKLYDVLETAKLQRESIENPKRTVLMGNHDIPYFYKRNNGLYCSGHEPFKYETIDSLVPCSHYREIKFYTFANRYLVSHAGVHVSYLEPETNSIKKDLSIIDKECRKNLAEGQMHFFVAAGRCRGGPARIGGITWLDFNQEFQPIQNVNQIVGHTKGNSVKTNHSEALNSKNHCIDTGLNHIAIVNTNSVSIINVSEL